MAPIFPPTVPQRRSPFAHPMDAQAWVFPETSSSFAPDMARPKAAVDDRARTTANALETIVRVFRRYVVFMIYSSGVL